MRCFISMFEDVLPMSVIVSSWIASGVLFFCVLQSTRFGRTANSVVILNFFPCVSSFIAKLLALASKTGFCKITSCPKFKFSAFSYSPNLILWIKGFYLFKTRPSMKYYIVQKPSLKPKTNSNRSPFILICLEI